MVICESSINNIMGGIENTGGVTLHNHRRKLKQRFDIIKKLGQGTYGKVQLGINKETGQEVAIKTIKKCKIEIEADLIRIRREIQIMSSVQHPNIIHIYEVFENREKMVLVMEYAAGGELYDYLSERKVLAEEEARRIFRQIATAVYYCHKHKICHRDLKLENILLDENGNAKIADFGLSNVFDGRRLLATFCGSPLYASPEIVRGVPYRGPDVDCWSLGVLLYTLVYGAMPFDGSNFKRLVKQISQGDYFEPKKPSSASPLIHEMLTVIPEKRASIEGICSHWWVNAGYPDSCLEIAEELANQTPVRLDLLLSLAPPPPAVGSDKLVIAGDENAATSVPLPGADANAAAPANLLKLPNRSQSVGSLMDLVPTAERRIRDLVSSSNQDKLTAPDTSEKSQATEHSQPVQKKDTDMSADNNDEQKSTTQESKSDETKIPVKRKTIKKKSAGSKKTDQTLNVANKEEPLVPVENNGITAAVTDETAEQQQQQQPKTLIERRRSKIFDTAEKFQNLLTSRSEKPTGIEKPKKIFIPGVNVGGFKKEFERKASLTSVSSPELKKTSPKKNSTLTSFENNDIEEKENKRTQVDEAVTAQQVKDDAKEEQADETKVQAIEETESVPEVCVTKEDVERNVEMRKNAVNVISNAINRDGTRKSKSRPCVMTAPASMQRRPPPMPFGINGRSASATLGCMQPSSATPLKQMKDIKPSMRSSCEITLKSATLPRTKVHSDASPMEFKTEMAYRIENQPELLKSTQRSEILVPINNTKENELRVESEVNEEKTSAATMPSPPSASTSRSRIIPITFEKSTSGDELSPPLKPPSSSRKGVLTQPERSRSASLQRNESESDVPPQKHSEPIRKSPREYIIPIAVEGGGYVTPTLETEKIAKSMGKFTSDYETRNSTGRDSDTEDSFHMHRLRSSRPVRKIGLEHVDSVSSGEDDDDDGFEILTAENLFSTLLSRVRNLTQRLNSEDGGRLGARSRLLGNLGHGSQLWKLHDRTTDPFTRFSNQVSNGSSSSTGHIAPWRRSVSRDLASDIERVFSDKPSGVGTFNTSTATLPRGKSKERKRKDLICNKVTSASVDNVSDSNSNDNSDGNGNLSLNLTPALSRRLEKKMLLEWPTASLAADADYTADGLSAEATVEPEAKVSRRPCRRSVSLAGSDAPDRRRLGVGRPLFPPTPFGFFPKPFSSASAATMPHHAYQPRRPLQPDYYENCLYAKERKKRELETQKVLQEIRNKRQMSQQPALDELDRKIPLEKASKLIRPKSYPTEVRAAASKKESRRSGSPTRASSSRIQKTIRSLREQSEPRRLAHCASTESSLLQRAVSIQDFAQLVDDREPEQPAPGRKSISRILTLFHKYETRPNDKSKVNQKSKPNLGMPADIQHSQFTDEHHSHPDKCESFDIVPNTKFNNNYENEGSHENNNCINNNNNNDEENDNENTATSTQSHRRHEHTENDFLGTSADESVSDRILRKSFYSRFNEKRKKCLYNHNNNNNLHHNNSSSSSRNNHLDYKMYDEKYNSSEVGSGNQQLSYLAKKNREREVKQERDRSKKQPALLRKRSIIPTHRPDAGCTPQKIQ